MSLPNNKPYSHYIPFLQVFRAPDTCLDGYDILAVFGEQGCGPPGIADLAGHRDHAPAVGDRAGNCPQRIALLRGNRDEVPGRRALPKPDWTGEFDVHGIHTSGLEFHSSQVQKKMRPLQNSQQHLAAMSRWPVRCYKWLARCVSQRYHRYLICIRKATRSANSCLDMASPYVRGINRGS